MGIAIFTPFPLARGVPAPQGEKLPGSAGTWNGRGRGRRKRKPLIISSMKWLNEMHFTNEMKGEEKF
jgi:hypothetical protein